MRLVDFDKKVLAIREQVNKNFNWKDIIPEYETDDIDNILYSLKYLDPIDRVIWIIYSEVGSYRKAASVFGVSKCYFYKRMQEIKTKLKEIVQCYL